MWKKSLPLGTFHVGAIVTAPIIEITDFVPLWLWCLLFGGLVVGTAWAYSGDVAKWIRKRKNGNQEFESPIVTYTEATAIIDKYIAPAMVGAPSGVRISVRLDLLNAFSRTPNAKLGEFEYNGILLHEWIASNTAHFLVKYRGEMK